MGIPTATAQWRYYKSINSLKLALANLAMFIVTFAVFLRSKFTSKSRINSSASSKSVDTIAESENAEDSFSNYKSSTSTIADVSISPDTSSITTTTSYTAKGTNISNQILYVSCLFLVLTLIFTIIFKNYQQKLKNKTSKHYMKK